jgi:hypothetical protein
MQLDLFNPDEEDVLGSAIIDELLDMHSDFKFETHQGTSETIEVSEDPMDPWRGVWDNNIPAGGLDFNFDSVGVGGSQSDHIINIV